MARIEPDLIQRRRCSWALMGFTVLYDSRLPRDAPLVREMCRIFFPVFSPSTKSGKIRPERTPCFGKSARRFGNARTNVTRVFSNVVIEVADRDEYTRS